MKELQKYEIVNLLSYSDLGTALNLNFLSSSLEDSEYEPEIYYALIYRIKNPKLSILINSSGKIIFTGAKSIEDIETAHNYLIEKLSSLGYQPIKNAKHIQNMVVKRFYHLIWPP